MKNMNFIFPIFNTKSIVCFHTNPMLIDHLCRYFNKQIWKTHKKKKKKRWENHYHCRLNQGSERGLSQWRNFLPRFTADLSSQIEMARKGEKGSLEIWYSQQGNNRVEDPCSRIFHRENGLNFTEGQRLNSWKVKGFILRLYKACILFFVN